MVGGAASNSNVLVCTALGRTTFEKGVHTMKPIITSIAVGAASGNAASAPGSAFNPNGTARTVYAGQQPQNSRNTASVSQYDVACSHQK